jgi:hypothetical protein
MNNIVGISGRIGSGKDTVANMIQYYIADQKERYSDCLGYYPSLNEYLNGRDVYHVNYVKDYENSVSQDSGWMVKKFASKIKTIASILTGISVEKFEDQEFKKTLLGEEWNAPKEFYHEDGSYDGVGDEPMSVRLFLQKLGTEGLRGGLHCDVWVNALWADWYDRKESTEFNISNGVTKHTTYPKWIITDTRFHNELKSVKDRGGITLRLTRNSNVPATHPSEIELDNAEFDYVIDNQNLSLDETYDEVKKFCIHYDLH